jgi:hypothetical protein
MKLLTALSTLLIGQLLFDHPARADDADKILRSMSTYITAQNTIAAKFDVELQIVTPQVEKITFAASGDVTLQRPDKLHVTRTGGYADVELFFDGKSATLYGKHLQRFLKVDAAGTVDQLIETLRGRGVALPFADILVSDPYRGLTDGIIEAKHVGRGVIGGVECEHLAFRTDDLDWQIWIEVGPNPVPRKFVITSRMVTGAPHYALLIREWKTGAAVPAATFEFRPPAGAEVAGLEILRDMDELPAPAAPKGKN